MKKTQAVIHDWKAKQLSMIDMKGVKYIRVDTEENPVTDQSGTLAIITPVYNGTSFTPEATEEAAEFARLVIAAKPMRDTLLRVFEEYDATGKITDDIRDMIGEVLDIVNTVKDNERIFQS
jgi:hypothetical protein